MSLVSLFSHRKFRTLFASVAVAGTLTIGFAALADSFPPTTTVGGKSLKRIGTGLREFLFFDIYRLGAYSESGNCSPSAIVDRDETKFLRLQMLREIPKDRMTSQLRDSLQENLPANASAELKGQVDTFISYFKGDLVEGARVEISYQPGQGTALKQNGQTLGPAIPGKPFADVVWRAYFGSKTCCTDLKEEVLEQCRGGS